MLLRHFGSMRVSAHVKTGNKENTDATATKAEDAEREAAETAHTPRDPHTPHHLVSQVPGPPTGPHGVPDLRDVQGTRRDPDSDSGPRGITPTPAPHSAFLSPEGEVDETRALVFPGQGAQSIGMGKDLYEQFPQAKALYDEADEILGFGLSRICFEGPEEELLQTRNTQPAIAVTSIALLRVALDLNPKLANMRPAFVAGHSLGEYSSLVAAGALEFSEAMVLLRRRAELMQSAGEKNPGTMAAVIGLDIAECEAICREAGSEVCTVNAPGQIVIGGSKEAVVRTIDYATARGAKKVIPVKVGGAFHSSLMRPAGDGLVQPVAMAPIRAPSVPVIANCSATPISTETEIRHELVDQVTTPVQWAGTVEYLIDQKIDTFIEFGPGKVLTGIIKRMHRKSTCINVNSVESVELNLP